MIGASYMSTGFGMSTPLFNLEKYQKVPEPFILTNFKLVAIAVLSIESEKKDKRKRLRKA
jgi:hypothetical protein